MKFIAVIIWMSSPVSSPNITAVTGEVSMKECLAAVERAYNATSARVVTGACMTPAALDKVRTML